MNSLTADATLQRSLDALVCLTEIRDAQGNVIGYFAPVGADKAAAAYSQAAARFDAEEMRRRKQSGENGLTTEEVLRHLESLER